jgi:hypothetical protein
MPVRQLLDVGSWQQLSVDLLLWDGGSVPKAARRISFEHSVPATVGLDHVM